MGVRTLREQHVDSRRTFYADEPEDLAYLKRLAKDISGDEDRWPELTLRIYGRPSRTTKIELTVVNDIGNIPGTLTNLAPPERIMNIVKDAIEGWRDLKVSDIKVVKT